MSGSKESTSLVGFWKKEMKHNIGLMLIATLALFFQIFSPLYTQIISFDSISGHQAEIRNVILSATVGDEVMVTLALEMSILAVAIGILLMGDFYSRKRRDFYFSLPVGRNKLFWLVYSLGIASVAASKAFTKRGEEDTRLPIVFSKPAWVVKGILLFTLLSFHLYAVINLAESHDYPKAVSVIGVILAAIMDIGLGTFLLDRFYDRDKEHYGKTLKQQGILAMSCIGLFIVSYFAIR